LGRGEKKAQKRLKILRVLHACRNIGQGGKGEDARNLRKKGVMNPQEEGGGLQKPNSASPGRVKKEAALKGRPEEKRSEWQTTIQGGRSKEIKRGRVRPLWGKRGSETRCAGQTALPGGEKNKEALKRGLSQ